MKKQQIKDYTDAAFNIGAILSKSAMHHDDKCSWLYAAWNENQYRTVYKPMSFNFYEGTSGIAFFLFNLYDLTREKIFLTNAIAALNHATFLAEHQHGDNYSLYTGTSGVAFTCIKAASVTGDDTFLKKAFKLIDDIPGDHYPDKTFDYMHGHAGTISFLCEVSEKFDKKPWINKAERIAEGLLKEAIVKDNTLTWPQSKESNTIHTGFGHGASGMAYGFSQLYKVTKKEKYKALALQCLAYDDAHFNEEDNCWNILNVWKQEGITTALESNQMGWCYGSAGNGLSRLSVFKNTGDEHAMQMTEVACNVAMQSLKMESNYSLCHGHFSNAALLFAAGNQFENKTWINEAYSIADKGIDDYFLKDRPWLCGSPTNQWVPCFMTGIAGIGNFYLHLMHPEKYASGLIIGYQL